MIRTTTTWAPWIVHAVWASYAIFRALGEDLPFLASLAAAWTVALLAIRWLIASTTSRAGRFARTALFAGIAFVLGWEGGIYVLPALAAFAIADLVDPRTPPYPFVVPMRGFAPVILVLIAILALAAGLLARPLYSSAQATVAPAASASP